MDIATMNTSTTSASTTTTALSSEERHVGFDKIHIREYRRSLGKLFCLRVHTYIRTYVTFVIHVHV